MAYNGIRAAEHESLRTCEVGRCGHTQSAKCMTRCHERWQMEADKHLRLVRAKHSASICDAVGNDYALSRQICVRGGSFISSK
jgi:hypothetical protein